MFIIGILFIFSACTDLKNSDAEQQETSENTKGDIISLIQAATPAGHYPYLKDENYIYYQIGGLTGWRLTLGAITQADVETFETLDRGYAKDKNNAYFYDQIIAEADVETFEVIQSSFSHFVGGYGEYGYAKDKNNVYYNADILENANAKTFSIEDARKHQDLLINEIVKEFST